MKTKIFIGVDGGATKSLIRIESMDGKIFGQKIGGPASIKISVEETWQTILTGIYDILDQYQITFYDQNYAFFVGMGLAGCEIKSIYQAFQNYPHPFTKLAVTSDSHVACLAAHGGHDGAIIIAGTGVVGYQIQAEKITQVGGWGFPHDDMGGGAWLGMQAMRLTLQSIDGRFTPCRLTQLVKDYFDHDLLQMVAWANQATPRLFGTLAPLVMRASGEQDKVAIDLLRRAAEAINQIDAALYKAQLLESKPLPCALIGSIAPFLQPYLGQHLLDRLQPSKMTPDQGAILYIKQLLQAESFSETLS